MGGMRRDERPAAMRGAGAAEVASFGPLRCDEAADQHRDAWPRILITPTR